MNTSGSRTDVDDHNADTEADADPLAALARARSAAQRDPVGFGVIEALARRASAQHGEARRLMTRRIEALTAAQAVNSDRADRTDALRLERAGGAAALAGLSELVDRLGRVPTVSAAASAAPGGPANPAPAPTAPAALKAVTAFKATWSRLRAEQRLRQALDQVPAMAGPLNSAHLVNRALQAMHDLSPAYLDAFMAHIDTLLWLEQASGGAEPLPRPAAPVEGKRKPAARAPRKA